MPHPRARIARLLALPALLTLGAAPAPVALDYDIVTNGEVNGALAVTLGADGRVDMRNHYQSQDKVRDLSVGMQLDAAGVPQQVDRTGQSFAFQPINEHFALEAGQARWSNRIEHGAQALTHPAYYIPLGLSQTGDSAAYELGLLAAATLRAGGRLPLLPVGEARARVVQTLDLANGDARETVRLVAIEGLGIEPDYVWLDSADRLFAARNAIRRGWRAQMPDLIRARAAADAAMVKAALDAPTDAAPTLIRNVAVFDAPAARLLPARDVLIRDGVIQSVGPHRALAAAPGLRVIEGAGHTLLPGLWDLHVHLSGAREVLRHLATGVTTVRDMGNDNQALARLRAQIDGGTLPGPTVIQAGFIEGRSPSATYNGRLVGSEAEAVAAVDAYAKEGAAQIKLYNAVHPEWVPAIARAAHGHGLRLSGHIPFGAHAEDMVRAGYDEIQHWVFLYLTFAPQPVNTGLTFAAARMARDVPQSSPRFTAMLDVLNAHHTVIDVTLSIYEPLLTGRPGVPAPAFARSAIALPPAMLRQIATGPLPTPKDMTDADFHAAFDRALALTKLLEARHIQVIAGTDSQVIGGLSLPRELELQAKAGLSPARVLQIATIDAARIMHRDRMTGSVAPGKAADLVLVRGDPTRDIAAVRAVDLVIKQGRAYQPRRLFAAAGLQ